MTPAQLNPTAAPVAAPPARPSALDVAEMILRELGPLDGLKLQKLVYYVQAMSLGSRGEPLFPERIEAWTHGPVVSVLYQMHAGSGSTPGVAAVGGNVEHLDMHSRALIREVLKYYGQMSGLELRALSHSEEPWKLSRGSLPENAPSTNPITEESMLAYYATRPWGGGQPTTDLSMFSIENVRLARQQIAEGRVVDLSSLGVAAA